MGSYNFAAQYQQRPAPAGGGMIKANWFLRYDPASPPTWSRVIQSWDCASKKSELADYSVCTTWGVEGDRYYLLHVYREKVDFPEMKAAVIRQADMFKANIVLIEDASSGIQLLQQLQVDGFHKAQAVKVTDNAKTNKYSPCNATESLLVARGVAGDFLPRMGAVFAAKGVEMRGCPESLRLLATVAQHNEARADARRQTRIGISTYSAGLLSFWRISVGAPASARCSSTVSPSIWLRMSFK